MGLVEVDVVTLASEFPNDNPALHRGVSWLCLDVTGAPVPILDALVPDEPVQIIETPITLAEPAIETPPVTHVPVPVPVPDPVLVVVAAAPELEPELDHELQARDEEPVPPARISGIIAITDRFEIENDLLDELADDTSIVVEDLPPLEESATLEGVVIEPVIEPATALPPACDDPFLILVSTLSDIAISVDSPHVASVLPALLIDGHLEHAMPADAAAALAEANIVRDGKVTAAFVAQTHAWRAILLGTSDDFAACGGAMLDEWAADLLARLLGAPTRATALRRDLRSHGVAAFGLVEAAA